ncbi:uracil-DNA glycosylase family protein [Escherichia coli]
MGHLESWARQGVLLNQYCVDGTRRSGAFPRQLLVSFTDKVISLINQHREGVVFLLWGSHAQKKGAIIDKQRHHVLKAPHPSPLSAHRGFFGLQPFCAGKSVAGQYCQTPIDWMPVLPAESE